MRNYLYQEEVVRRAMSRLTTGRVRVFRPSRLSKPGVNPVGIGGKAEKPAAEVPFGPSGLTLYPADLAHLERVRLRAGRAATGGDE